MQSSCVPAQGVVIAFARLPTAGKVKTRLAAGVGGEQAARLYDLLLRAVLQQASRCSACTAVVACATEQDRKGLAGWLQAAGLALPLIQQLQAPDLGDRMNDALAWGLEQGMGKACVIGTDIPELSHTILDEAQRLLETYEVVLGPAVDGGFYLVGVSRLVPDMMQGISWSSSTTRQQVRDQAGALGLRLAPDAALPCLQDIDTVQDLRDWALSSAVQTTRSPAALVYAQELLV